jgi:hypothetical protein
MTLKHALVPAIALVALSLTAVPLDAQQRRGAARRGDEARTAPRAGAPQQRSALRQTQPGARVQQQQSNARRPQSSGQPQQSYAQQPRSGGQQGRSYGQQTVPRQGPAPRAYDRGYDSNRGSASRAPAYGYGNGSGYRGDPGYRAYVAPRGGYGYGHGYRPYYYPRPYYSFRPRLSLGFGLWIGFPTAYPFYSYGYANPAYGYPLSTFGLAPGAAYGGISFEVDPYDAAVFIDGAYLGIVNDFGPNAQPLTLRAGTHRVEIQAAGCAPVVFDVSVMPGQVIPYRGALRPY